MKKEKMLEEQIKLSHDLQTRLGAQMRIKEKHF